jgi:hypothetical protein
MRLQFALFVLFIRLVVRTHYVAFPPFILVRPSWLALKGDLTWNAAGARHVFSASANLWLLPTFFPQQMFNGSPLTDKPIERALRCSAQEQRRREPKLEETR